MKRSIIITLALIAAIAVPLCASSGWARGLGVLGLGGGNGAEISQFLVDSFSESSADTILSAHSPEVGGSWDTDGTPVTVSSIGGYISVGNGVSAVAINSVTPPDNDYTVSVVGARTGTASHTFGAVARVTNDGSGIDGYFALYNRSTTQKFFLTRRDNGVSTVLAEYNLTDNAAELGLSSYRKITLTVSGNNLEAKLYSQDGNSVVSTLTATDSTYSTGGVGVNIYDDSVRITSIVAE